MFLSASFFFFTSTSLQVLALALFLASPLLVLLVRPLVPNIRLASDVLGLRINPKTLNPISPPAIPWIDPRLPSGHFVQWTQIFLPLLASDLISTSPTGNPHSYLSIRDPWTSEGIGLTMRASTTLP